MSQPWIPSASDIVWTDNLLSKIASGGLWFVPSSNGCYRIDKENKIATLEFGAQNDAHSRIRLVLEALGYEVVVPAASGYSLEEHM